MQIKSIAQTDFLSMLHNWEHASPEQRAALEGRMVAAIDGHVREQLIEADERRATRIHDERRHIGTTYKH